MNRLLIIACFTLVSAFQVHAPDVSADFNPWSHNTTAIDAKGARHRVISRSMAGGSRVITTSTRPGENDGYGYLVYVAQCRADCNNMSDLRNAFPAGKLTP